MDNRMTYLTTHVTPVLQPIIKDLIAKQPEDPLQFIYDWIGEHHISSKKEGSTLTSDKLQQLPQNDPKNKIIAKELDKGSEHSFVSDEEDDYCDEIPIVRNTGAVRKSISAEAFGLYNKREAFVARNLPKTEEQREHIREKLLSSFLFSALAPREIETVVGAMEERSFQPGEQVICQGDEGDNLYVVESGKLTCTKYFPKEKQEKFLKEYVPGESFGELALLYSTPRAASIFAKTECVLWSLDRGTFNNIVKEAAMKKRERYESFLRSVELLGTIKTPALTSLIDAIKERRFAPQEMIIREGEEGNVFYFLESGEAYATKCLEPFQPPLKVMEYKRGSYFGELALMRNAPRAANVIAKSECICLSLDRHSFKRILGPFDEYLKNHTEAYNHYMKKLA